jgi:50S ribosomal subunit-associated GTPase HflX
MKNRMLRERIKQLQEEIKNMESIEKKLRKKRKGYETSLIVLIVNC